MTATDEQRDSRTHDLTGHAGSYGVLFALRLAGLSRRELHLRSELAIPLESRR